MFKKLVSLFLLACTVFVCIPFGMVFAQSEEDFIKSIPIVEFQPSTKNDTDCYSKSNIISVSKETALSTESSVLKSLISEDRVVFFEKMTSEEVVLLTGIDGIYSIDVPNDQYIIGTLLTYQDGRTHYIESFAMDINQGDIDLTSEDITHCVKKVYSRIKPFDFYSTKGALESLPFDAIYTEHKTIYDGSAKMGEMYATSYLYSYGKKPVNNKNMYVYDVKTSFLLDPVDNRCLKQMGLLIGCGTNNNYFVDISEIETQGISDTYEVTVNYTIGQGFAFGATRGWSHDAKAFRSTSDLSDPTLIRWTINPVKPENNETWIVQPGVRFVAEHQHVLLYIGFNATLYSTSIFKPHPVAAFLQQLIVRLESR